MSQRSGADSGTQLQIVRTGSGGLAVSRQQTSQNEDTLSLDNSRDVSSTYSVGAQPGSRSK